MFLMYLVSLFLVLAAIFWKKIYTFPRDIHVVFQGARLVLYQKYLEFFGQTSIDVFMNTCKKQPQKTAFIHGDKTKTYIEVEEQSNQISHYFKSIGVERGDCVALMMDGNVEYPIVWLGLAKLGAITALINTNQTKTVLKRSIELVKAKWLVYGTNYTKVVGEILPEMEVKLFYIGEDTHIDGSIDLMSAINSQPKTPLTHQIELTTQRDPILYIYTSGTTGLPKAAIITHARFIMMALGAKFMLGIRNDDIVYTSLPLYHSAGGLLGVGQVILGGATVVIRSKFSASNFFKDCVKYNCTVAQYIGEICRYILTTPKSEFDQLHQVRLLFGNGLRKEVWEGLVDRFKIKQIGEFYGATEGNASLINAWNQVGAVGYIPWFATLIYPIRLIRVDELTNEPIRDPQTGLCIPCDIGEPGLLVGRILTLTSVSQFNGYVDKEATKKKILKNVMTKGDSFFNSGDILYRDQYGYMYFRDRTGDTFRWKGENVSTTEIEGIISKILGQIDATVYGVEIPNTEGRAGMAAIVSGGKDIDMETFYKGIVHELSPYARPVFVRIANELPFTGTFKIQKTLLQKEGFDINKIKDPIYFLDPKLKSYVKMDLQLYNDIVNNVIKL